jgi:Uma2 family endonuclease
VATVAAKLLTAEEFSRMPDPADGSQQELIRGVVITMPPPGARHGACCLETARLMGNHVKPNKLGKLTCNDAGFLCEQGPDTVVGPDIAFWSIDRLSEVPVGYPLIPPDLAVEVVSPSDTQSRLQRKLLLYLRARVKLIWFIDPELRIVTVYRSLEKWGVLENGDTLSGEEVLPGFTCKVSELFGD